MFRSLNNLNKEVCASGISVKAVRQGAYLEKGVPTIIELIQVSRYTTYNSYFISIFTSWSCLLSSNQP